MSNCHDSSIAQQIDQLIIHQKQSVLSSSSDHSKFSLPLANSAYLDQLWNQSLFINDSIMEPSTKVQSSHGIRMSGCPMRGFNWDYQFHHAEQRRLESLFQPIVECEQKIDIEHDSTIPFCSKPSIQNQSDLDHLVLQKDTWLADLIKRSAIDDAFGRNLQIHLQCGHHHNDRVLMDLLNEMTALDYKATYLSNIQALTDDEASRHWQQLEKPWETFAAHGLGYESWAKHLYTSYKPIQTTSVDVQYLQSKNPIPYSELLLALIHNNEPAHSILECFYQHSNLSPESLTLEREPTLLSVIYAHLSENCYAEAFQLLQSFLSQFGVAIDLTVQECLTFCESIILSRSIEQGYLTIGISILYYLLRNDQQSLLKLEESLEIFESPQDPLLISIWNRIAVLYYYQHKEDVSKSHVQMILEKEPHHPKALHLLSLL